MSSLNHAAKRLWRYLPERARSPLAVLRYGAPAHRQWARTVMNRDIARLVADLHPQSLDVVEVSGSRWGDCPWKSRTTLSYPAFDLCHPPDVITQYDLVICEQVLEHVVDPITAVRTLRALCRPDGHVLVSTPFLMRIHGDPDDYWRFTPAGITKLLESQRLAPICVRSWGNRRAVRGNLGKWALALPWRSLANEPELPLVVWALSRPKD